MNPWLLIPCERSRLEELKKCISSWGDIHYNRITVVTTEPNPIREGDDLYCGNLIVDRRRGINWSRWLNFGLDYIHGIQPTERLDYEVLVSNSDVLGTPESIRILANEMRATNSVMAGPDWHPPVKSCVRTRTFCSTSKRSVFDRVTGTVFMLAGEKGLRFDERFRWWYADDHLEMVARNSGGSCLVRDTGIQHISPNGNMLSEEKAKWAIEDRELFKIIWKREPH